MRGAAPSDTRTRILVGALQSVERLGMAKTSLEDVAQTAGVSRATIYRYFPGGRDEVITETVSWEVENFLGRIVDAVEGLDTIDDKLQAALLTGHRAIGDHLLLQQLLSTEPEALFRELAEIGPLMRMAIAGYIADELRGERLLPGVDVDEASDYCSRLFLSYIGSHGANDLSDPAAVARIVETQVLAGVLDRSAPA
jgi:AcrR family transcriptional regulator